MERPVVRCSVSGSDNAGGGVVATYVRKDSFITQTGGSPMGELNLVTYSPALARPDLKPFARYGWAYLFGQRLTTIPWLDVSAFEPYCISCALL